MLFLFDSHSEIYDTGIQVAIHYIIIYQYIQLSSYDFFHKYVHTYFVTFLHYAPIYQQLIIQKSQDLIINNLHENVLVHVLLFFLAQIFLHLH